MQLSSPEVLTLSSGLYSAVVAPAAGGRVASLQWKRGELTQALLVDWDRSPFDEHAWPKAGSFPMIPFAVRLPRSGVCIEGRMVRPTPGPDGIAMHGLAHRRPWAVVDATVNHAVLALQHCQGEEAWPWDWSATQEISVGGDGMRVGIRVRNDSTDAMPLNIGWHPYHPLDRGVAADDLWHDATSPVELDHEGTAVESSTARAFDLLKGGTVPYAAWGGHLRLRASDVGTIVVRTSASLAVVLHRPANGAGYFCAEPLTSLPGHLTLLAPGAERSLEWCCSFEAAED